MKNITRGGFTAPDYFGSWIDETDQSRQWEDEQTVRTCAAIEQRPEYAWVLSVMESIDEIEIPGKPIYRGDRVFQISRPARKDGRVLKIDTSEGTIVVADCNEIGGRIADLKVNTDGSKLSYTWCPKGTDTVELRFYDVDQREQIDVIPATFFPVVDVSARAFLADGSGSVYMRSCDPNVSQSTMALNLRFFVHRWGDDPSRDEQLLDDGYLGEKDSHDFPIFSQDGKWLMTVLDRHPEDDQGQRANNIVELRNLKSNGVKTILEADNQRVAAKVATSGDWVYVMTRNQEYPFGIIRGIDINRAWDGNWKVIVSHRDGHKIHGFVACGNRIAVKEQGWKGDSVSIWCGGERVCTTKFDGAISSMSFNEETEELIVDYSNQLLMFERVAIDLKDFSKKVIASLSIPGLDPNDFEVKDIEIASHDGVMVPVHLIVPVGVNGPVPLLLHSYSGHKATHPPQFWRRVAPWFMAGGAYAWVHARGSSAKGDAWGEAGIRENTGNRVKDVIYAARDLVGSGLTTSSQISYMGSSNGGLLGGMLAAEDPGLFRAMVLHAGVYDLWRLDKGSAWGFAWRNDIGHPDDPNNMRVLSRLSPLHNVNAASVENTAFLLTWGRCDDRVVPHHSRRFAFRLLELQGQEIYPRVEPDGDHYGDNRNSVRMKEEAAMSAFLMWKLGLTPKS